MRAKFSAGIQMLLLISISALLSGCMKDSLTRTYTILTPVFEKKSVVISNIKSSQPQILKSPGKIYISGRYIFLNEVGKGVHIIDNGNPSAPKSVSFISIPGNIDIAVSGHTLYADLFTDMAVIDISDPLNSSLIKVIPNVFPERIYGNNFSVPADTYVTDWNRKDTTVPATQEANWGNCRNCVLFSADAQNKASYVPGIAGSMTRFTIVNQFLYAVNLSSLNAFDISTSTNPVSTGTVPVGWNIETIYPFKDKLFIGSSNGMFIYDITQPQAPVQQGIFSHARACDPVVANDDLAFVTLRTGTFCMGTSNQLDVINVSNVMVPRLVKTYPMTNPHGLAIDGDLLFVCDGKDGLKMYNVAQNSELKLQKTIPGLDAYDVIAWNKHLLLVASSGLYQFDYSDPSNLKLLSTFAVNRK